MEFPDPPFTLTFDPDGEMVLKQDGSVQVTEDGRRWVREWDGKHHVSRWLEDKD